jgi:hypothetical protein
LHDLRALGGYAGGDDGVDGGVGGLDEAPAAPGLIGGGGPT